MFFMRVKSKKRIKSIKNTKRQDVKQANKSKNDNYAHKTSKRKKITMRIKTSKRKKITMRIKTFKRKKITYLTFYAFYFFYAFYSFYACEITLTTSFTILLTCAAFQIIIITSTFICSRISKNRFIRNSSHWSLQTQETDLVNLSILKKLKNYSF